MLTTLILFWSLVGIAGSHAQSLAPEAIAAAGGHFSGPDAQLSWTLGESVSEHFSGTGSAQLPQGFHQANLTIVPVDGPGGSAQMTEDIYWSASERHNHFAWFQGFDFDIMISGSKANSLRCRCVRR